MEASVSLGRHIIGWRQSKTTGKTLREKVAVRQFGQAIDGILAGDYAALHINDTENDFELKKEVEEWKLHTMAKVHNVLEMWQGSQRLHVTQKESHARNEPMTAIEYISDTEEIIKASWSNFQHNGVAAFKLSERSPLLPTLSAKDLPGGRTQVLNVCPIRRINRHPAESDEDSAPESISNTENWLDWNGALDNPNVSDDGWGADDRSDIALENGIDAPATPEHRDVCTTPNVSGLIMPTWRSLKQAAKVLMMVTAMETRRSKGYNTK